MKTRSKPSSRERGFALVISLTLMVLLAVIAIGMLTLSTISLRTSTHGEAMATARANARLALVMALGELQTAAGLDQRITASANLVSGNLPKGVTGVWEAWEPSERTGRRNSQKPDKFVQWLVSSPQGTPTDPTAPPVSTSGSADMVRLLAEGSLGAASNPSETISVEPVEVDNGKTRGGYAWVVIDENQKSRINLAEAESTNLSVKAQSVLRAGDAPTDGVAALPEFSSFDPDTDLAAKLVTMPTVAVSDNALRDPVAQYNTDLTVYSNSLLTNPVGGGLKKDLSLYFSQSLNDNDKKEKLYESAGLETNDADPTWGLLAGHHNLYKDLGEVANDGLKVKLPARYNPIAADPAFGGAAVANPTTPTDPILVPTVARVDVIFSLVTRDGHGNRQAVRQNYPYMVHLLYLPVVTIHNPYDIPLSMDDMKITFKNIPVGFQLYVQGQPMSTALVPLNQMYWQSTPQFSKDFSFTLRNSRTGSSPITLKPGQTRLFGTPRVDPSWTWADEGAGNPGADGTQLFDQSISKNFTVNFPMMPMMMTDPASGAGFDLDWFSPVGMQTPEHRPRTQNGEGVVHVKPTEQISISYGPVAPAVAGGNFQVAIETTVARRTLTVGNYTVRYGNLSQLKKILEEGTSLRYPQARRFPEYFPKNRVDPTFTAQQIHEESNKAVSQYNNAKPFAIFSLSGKTTLESFAPIRVMEDGNFVQNLAKVDLSSSTNIGAAPVEMSLVPIRGGNNIGENRTEQEGYFFGGHNSTHGSPRSVIYEIPRGPLQSVAQLRHANLAGAGFPARTTYTVGESFAHPMVGTDRVKGTSSNGAPLLDHTWLANEALWDAWFFSTIAPQEGSLFPNSASETQVMENFFDRTAKLPNQRYVPYGSGTTVPSELKGSDPYLKVAAHLMMAGGFNVNSTSEDAWVSVLSGLRNTSLETFNGNDPADAKATAFPRTRYPGDTNIEDGGISSKDKQWLGYRRLTDGEIRTLAQEIVSQVRTRGPFLSMADFVNRGIGADTQEENLKGALQAAIDRAGLNTSMLSSIGIELDESQVSSYGYQSPKAAVGNTALGSSSSLLQGDVLSAIGAHLTVRSDTFKIRAYGEARTSNGRDVTARAWCEAVVQRIPEFVDPSNAAFDQPSGANQIFGRRYEVVAFRWLRAEEV